MRIMSLLLLLLTVVSCQQESDTLVPYDHADVITFGRAENSFAEKFKLFRDGMSQNYALWDYERECGVNWDEHCDSMLPKFEELDKRPGGVMDFELEELMEEMVRPLHDGHLAVYFTNHKTGNRVMARPSDLWIKNRDDYFTESLEKYMFLLMPYQNKGDESEILEDYSASTSQDVLMYDATSMNGKVQRFLSKEIERLMDLVTPTETETRKLQDYRRLSDELAQLSSQTGVQQVNSYNNIVLKYAYLNVPGLERISPSFASKGMSITYALFKGNIAYLYLSSFSLSDYIDPAMFAKMTDMNGRNLVLARQIKTAWSMWFNKIQELHAAGKLGGVIIDLRNNGGGYSTDFQYVLGALLPSGGYNVGYLRFKRGTGRYDYSPLMLQNMATYSGEHAVINEPVAVLVNSFSASMSEVTSRGAQLMPNARVIGKRTWGAFCVLDENSGFSYNYSGNIGVLDVTPVFARVPLVSTLTMDGHQEEGQGLTPDIEVNLNRELFVSQQADTQLDRALEYIRTGK